MRVGNHSSRVPASSAAKPQTTIMQKGKQREKPSKSSPRQSTKAVALSASSQWDGASLEYFTRCNEDAMAALRQGDGTNARCILTTILPELEKRLRLFDSSSKRRSETDEVAAQSWRLVYALTLNNYGCQLRRDGRSDEALQKFELAKESESMVFGKPSCSTMLNLSAVLLSKGEAKEALKIATECAAAAQDGEPVLFITALHNLAVSLGQQSSERSRSAALPTMLRALRESQAALGEGHPTTKMLKQKCGLTSQWINSSSAVKLSASQDSRTMRDGQMTYSVPSQSSPQGAETKQSFPSSQERARAALYTLDFGKPVFMPQPIKADKKATKRDSSAMLEGKTASSVLGDSPLCSSSKKIALKASVSASADGPLSPLTEEKSTDIRASADQVLPPPLDGVHRDSNVAASVHELCFDSVHLSMTQLSRTGDELETVLQEPFNASVLSLHRHGATTLRDLCGTEQNGSAVCPSFLRFGTQLPPISAFATNSQVGDVVTATSSQRLHSLSSKRDSTTSARVFAQTVPITAKEHRDRNVLAQCSGDQREKEPISVFATAPVVQANDATSEHENASLLANATAKYGIRSSVTNSRDISQPKNRRTLFGHSTSRWSDRAAQRKAEMEEEEAYRRKVKAEEKAADAARTFEKGLERIQERTRTRAACVIQRAWQQWWTSVGRPRRHVQLQRLEELQRRRRDRLALASAAGKKPTGKSHTATVPPPPSKQHGRIAGFVVPAVVVRCARKWKDRTACVRCVARLTGSPVDARLHEADIHQRVCRLQALWRGVLQRRHDTKVKEGQALSEEERADAEFHDYAAMIVQCAYRRYAARQERQRLYRERYSAPAVKIQQWLRSTWDDQRQRGVDAPLLRKKNAAAVSIQRVWRGYQGRIAFHMRELRQRIDKASPYEVPCEHTETKEVPAPHNEDLVKKVQIPSVMATGASLAASTTDKEALTHKNAASSLPLPTAAAALSARAEKYEADCRQRGLAVQQLHDEERDRFHIPLYVETRATKERMAWQEALRLRQSDVVRRRAEFNRQIDAEQSTFVQERSARVIQRAYRAWNAMRHDPNRDTGLLKYSLMRYQQQELGRAVDRKQRMRDFAHAVELYGDTVLPMRKERELASMALAVAEGNVVCISDLSALTVEDKKRQTFPQSAFVSRSERAQRRRGQEAQLHRDERLLVFTQATSEAQLREGPEECKARLGTSYEHPYYVPYVNEEHRRTLGID